MGALDTCTVSVTREPGASTRHQDLFTPQVAVGLWRFFFFFFARSSQYSLENPRVENQTTNEKQESM